MYDRSWPALAAYGEFNDRSLSTNWPVLAALRGHRELQSEVQSLEASGVRCKPEAPREDLSHLLAALHSLYFFWYQICPGRQHAPLPPRYGALQDVTKCGTHSRATDLPRFTASPGAPSQSPLVGVSMKTSEPFKASVVVPEFVFLSEPESEE